MNLENFNQIKELEFLSGHPETIDEFTSSYEKILSEVRTRKDYPMVQAIQRVLFRQMAYVMCLWLREKAAMQQEEM